MSYKLNILSNFVTQIIIIIISFVTNVIVARSLGPTGQGKIAYLLLIFNLIASYGHLGILNSITYFQKRSEFNVNEIINVNSSYLFLNWIILSIVIILMKIHGIIFDEFPNLVIAFSLLYIILQYFQTMFTNIYIGDQKIHQMNKFQLYSKIFVLIILLILFLNKTLDVTKFYILFVIMVLLNDFFFIKSLKITIIRFKINFHLLAREFKYGIIVYLSAIFIFLNYRADQYIIKEMIGIKDLGIYYISVSIAELIFIIPASITSALDGKLFNTISINSRYEITSKTIKYTFYVSLIIAISGVLLSSFVTLIYGETYSLAIPSLRILLFGTLFASIGKVSFSYFATSGRPAVHLVVTFFVLIINISLNLLLIPWKGIMGAAIASAVSYFFYGITYILIYIFNEGFKLKDLMILTKSDINFAIDAINIIRIKKF